MSNSTTTAVPETLPGILEDIYSNYEHKTSDKLKANLSKCESTSQMRHVVEPSNHKEAFKETLNKILPSKFMIDYQSKGFQKVMYVAVSCEEGDSEEAAVDEIINDLEYNVNAIVGHLTGSKLIKYTHLDNKFVIISYPLLDSNCITNFMYSANPEAAYAKKFEKSKSNS